MMSFKISAAFVMLGAASTVSAHAASPLAVAVALENFKNAKIVPDVLSTFNPSGLMTLNFTAGVGRPAIGEAVARTNVSDTPVLMIRGSEEAEAQAGGPFNVTNTRYTVLCIDGNTAGSSNPGGYNLHYLENNLAYGENHDHTVTLNSTGSPVVAYAAPNPPSGSGPHRYIWLTYAQPGDFSAPSSPAPGSGVALFNLTQYTSAANLGNPIVGTYFTVQEGAANASVASTTAVDSTTLPQYTATATASTNSTHGDGHSNSGAKSTRANSQYVDLRVYHHESVQFAYIAPSNTTFFVSTSAKNYDALSCTPTTQLVFRRSFATPVDIAPHKLNIPTPVAASTSELAPLEKYIYDCILNGPPSAPLSRIHTEYKSHAGRVLDVQLPYESRPGAQRRSPKPEDVTHDILLLSIPHTTPRLRALPLSPYPAPEGSTLSVRLLSSHGQPELQSHGGKEVWGEWLDGFALLKWVTEGKVLGYRDLAGRESKPGTYDVLSHMLFNVLPTPGSSGAPLVDEHGAVVGMALGTRMDNRVEGNRGWGVPAELIYEMFTLPGLNLKKK
ncbi:trypsin-like peptidase domain protein [Rhizoctonia solani]|uniref:Trypsin-like peptidase domain protein n=1 Tax=Rhizoctonia solani TaxID=456999 RepID=A0A8H8NT84_9AGAM|nr:trypsin-like peptidase domain protein [Rhizoctonia solani]QRW19606.1 trypsin-like peptidase domain protein [Rhizoctonia solani]